MMLAMRAYMVLVAMEPEDIELLVKESAAGLMQTPRLRTLMIPPRVPLPIMLDVVKGIGEKSGAQWVEIYPDTAEPMRVWGSWFTIVAGMPAPGAEIVDIHKPEGQPEDEQETNWGLFRSHPWRWWENTRAKAAETYWLDEVFAKYLWDRSTDMAEFPTGAVKVVVRTGRLLKPRQHLMGWDNQAPRWTWLSDEVACKMGLAIKKDEGRLLTSSYNARLLDRWAKVSEFVMPMWARIALAPTDPRQLLSVRVQELRTNHRSGEGSSGRHPTMSDPEPQIGGFNDRFNHDTRPQSRPDAPIDRRAQMPNVVRGSRGHDETGDHRGPREDITAQ
jgi:hypothetical protein